MQRFVALITLISSVLMFWKRRNRSTTGPVVEPVAPLAQPSPLKKSPQSAIVLNLDDFRTAGRRPAAAGRHHHH